MWCQAKSMCNISIQQWNEIFPVLKDTMKKINKVYHPVGFQFTIPTGKLAGQGLPHLMAHIVPKYKKSYGNECWSKEYNRATPEQVEITKKVLQPNQDNIIAERNKVVAKLHNEMSFGTRGVFRNSRISLEIFRNSSKLI